MKPRILFLDHVGVLGGAEFVLVDIATHVRDRGRVMLFADGPLRETLEANGVHVQVTPAARAVQGVKKEGGIGEALRSIPGLFGLVRQVARAARDYDVLYASSQKAFVVASLAGRIARRPVLWHLHDLMSAEHFSAVHLRLAVGLSRSFAARVLTNSEASAAAFVESGGEPAKTHVVYYGIDAAPFEQVTPDETRRLRASLGLDGAPVVGCFSRLAAWKGQHVLLEALAAVPEAHALLIGGALFGDDAYAGHLHEQVRTLGLDGRVHFLGFRRDVPELMRLVDIVAHTSTAAEPFGRVIVEGMLAQKPVVATRAGGAVEIVAEDTTGLLVPPGDPGALAAALRRLLDHPEDARRMAEAGAAEARRRFAPERMLREVEQHVDAVAAGPGGVKQV